LETIWNSGIDFIVWFQGFGTWLTIPMKFFSFLGSEEFYLLILPVIYWCIDAGLGLRIGSIVLFSNGLNDILKLTLHGPRPYWYSTQVKAFAAETSFGVPSGHAQISTSLWGMGAAHFKRFWVWFLAGSVILVIGLSRLYLAVHFPHDVLAGWAIGCLTLWIFLNKWDAVAAWTQKKSMGQQIGIAFSVSMMMLIMGILAYGTLKGWVLPVEWLANAQQSGLDVLPSPVSLDSSLTSAGVMFGMLAGAAWMNARGGYDANGSFKHKVLRLFPGILGTLVLYLGLRAIFPRGDMFIAYFLRYIRFALVGLWISAGAPWCFQKLNLAQKKKS
jgi:membrane-associated phospholipid phosphatase